MDILPEVPGENSVDAFAWWKILPLTKSSANCCGHLKKTKSSTNLKNTGIFFEFRDQSCVYYLKQVLLSYRINTYTQYVFIRNGLIRNSSEIFRIFKEQLLKILEIRNKFFY